MDKQARIEALELRQPKLERQNKVLKVAAIGILALALLGAKAASDRSTDIVTAEGFFLIDSSGRTRASLGLTDDGEVGLWLIDRGGKTSVSLTQSSSEAELSFWDAQGDNRVVLGTEGATAGLTIFDSLGNNGINLAQSGDSSTLILQQTHLLDNGILIGNDAGRNTIDMRDDGGNRLAMGTVAATSSSYLGLLDKNSYGISLHRDGDLGYSELSLEAGDGASVSLLADDESSSMSLYNMSDVETWQALTDSRGGILNIMNEEGKD